jgi:benzil reductase ((S)-benzoin forming)
MFVITGGSSGMGKALAENLASKQQSVLILGRNKQALTQIAASSPHIQMLQANLTTPKGRLAVIKYLKNQKHIEALIHCAGVIEPITPLPSLDEAGWRDIFEVNLIVPFLLTQCLYDKLIGGRVLQISSHFAQKPVHALAAYCISKRAVSTLINCWQLECPEIASTIVLPGVVNTPMAATVRGSKHITPEQRQILHNLKNNDQLISPETVASFLAWLLLDVEKKRFSSQEWDIYDTSHHKEWLIAPHHVPPL